MEGEMEGGTGEGWRERWGEACDLKAAEQVETCPSMLAQPTKGQ